MRYKNYIIASFLSCLALGWTGCNEEEFIENDSMEVNSSSRVYNSRLITWLDIDVSSLEVDVTPISRANDDEITLSDMWYGVFDAKGQLVPGVNGESMRHRTLTNNQPDPIDEPLPRGKYTVAVLVMVKGGDANAVKAVKSLQEDWLQTGADSTLPGDFFYGQGTVEIQPEKTETLSVTMNRISALFTLNMEMADEAQKALLGKTELILDSALPYGSMSAGGALKPAATESITEGKGVSINMTEKSGSFYALTSASEPISCKGQLVVTISDEKDVHQRLYQVGGFTLERGKRTRHTLNLNLPFDRLGQLDQSAITAQSRMFANDESAATMTTRQFTLNAPLKVTFGKGKASIQFFSPVGIGHTEIYARIKSTRDYFKVYELDSIRPFDDITIASSLIGDKDGYYLSENGRIIKIPANANLTNDAIEYKVVCSSDYWKKIESIKISPVIGFYNGKIDGGANFRITPYHARLSVGMALNWGVMLCSPLFEKTLNEWPNPSLDTSGEEQEGFYYAIKSGVIYVTKEEIIDRIYNSFGKCAVLFSTGANLTTEIGANGVVTPYGATSDGRKRYIYTLWDPVWDTLYGRYQYLGYVSYHELAHLMNYPDSYDVPGGNTMAAKGYKGWTALCAMVYYKMCDDNELPASTLNVITDLDY